MGAFTTPSPSLFADLEDAQGQTVGRASYALSPLADRWYVYDLSIEEGQRGRGYGLAFLAHLAALHAVPITPVQELQEAQSFWRTARARRVSGLHVTGNMSVNQMQTEKLRWQHLGAEADQLEREVGQRFLKGESWDMATGRGLRSTNAFERAIEGSP